MSRQDNSDNSMWLLPFITLLMMIALNQCTELSDIKEELRDIKHEIHMLKYNN